MRIFVTIFKLYFLSEQYFIYLLQISRLERLLCSSWIFSLYFVALWRESMPKLPNFEGKTSPILRKKKLQILLKTGENQATNPDFEQF